MMEKKAIFERLQRLVRAVVDCKGHDHDAVGTRTALELARAISAESWEGRATQLTQVPNIGPVAMRKLAAGGVRTVLELAEKDQHQIEHLVGRNAPFGKKLLEELQKFPRLSLDLKTAGHRIQPRNSEAPVILNVAATIRCLNKALPLWGSGKKPPLITFVAETQDGTLSYFWRGSARKLDLQSGLELPFPATLRFANDFVTCRVSCEDIVGTEVVMSLNHNLPGSVFPSATSPTGVPAQLRKPAPAAQQPPIPLLASRETNQGYLDDFDIDDVDLIEAAEKAMSSLGSARGRETPSTAKDSLPRPRELPKTVPASQIQQEEQGFDEILAADGSYDHSQPDDAPVQLPNGKWRCNHACGGGGLTKTGKPCTHACCKEGLDKPRKRPLPKPKKRKANEVEDDSIQINTQPKPSFQQPKITETFSKRTKTSHERSSQSQFADSAPGVSKLEPVVEVTRPRVALLSQNNFDVGADLGNIECIDLSGLDDEPAGSATNSAHLKAPSQIFQDAGLEELFSRGAGYSIRPGDGPFREGGKDQILFQISKQEAANANYHSPAKSDGERMPRGGSAWEDTPAFNSSVADFCDDLEMGDLFEEFELSKSKDVASTKASVPGKTRTAAAEETLPTERPTERHAKTQEEEPDWVSQSDPELVKLFRGVVKFV
jgi:ATP-dependent DNA helicase HFM1/MER3